MIKNIVFLISALFTYAQIYALDIIPEPTSYKATNGSFELNDNTTIRTSVELMPIAEYLRGYIPQLEIKSTIMPTNAILLSIDSSLKQEAYSITVNSSFIQIKGGDYGGVFNGVQSLMQLLPAQVYSSTLRLPTSVECCTIEDKPRFGYRAMMLDVARTWMGVGDIKRHIDMLAHHKINTLHLHLTDNEGWRIEIKSHPELTQIGAYRGGASPIRPVYGAWNHKYGGYFTQEQIKELIEYAKVRNIEIIPEIDLPGHSCNIANIYPQIKCNYTPRTWSSNGYDIRNVWCVAKEENYALLDDILREICELFPSEHIHIGGDEVDAKQWEPCPDCQALMKSKGITETPRLADVFMRRAIDILAKYGKQAAVWNEAAERGDIPLDTRVYGWEGVKESLHSAKMGYPTVVMPGDYFYFDMRQSQNEVGHMWAGISDAKKVRSFDFTAKGFSEELMKSVVGVEGAFWSELYISNNPSSYDYIDYMLYPRVCALAEVGWSGTTQDGQRFHDRLVAEHYPRMEQMGIGFRLSPPVLKYSGGMLSATNNDGAPIYYTEDGITTPTSESKLYTGAIATQKPHLYQFASAKGTAKSKSVAHSSFARTIRPKLTTTTSMGESTKAKLERVNAYSAFANTARTSRAGDWILYEFPEGAVGREFFIQTGHQHLPKTIIPNAEVFTSADGSTFTKVGELKNGSITIRPTERIQAIKIVSTGGDDGTNFVTIQPPKIKPIL